MKPRAEYEASSLSRTQPWKAENISRAEWYRRRTEAETSLPAIKLTTVTGIPVSEPGLVLRPPLTPAPADLYLRLYALGLLDDVPDYR